MLSVATVVILSVMYDEYNSSYVAYRVEVTTKRGDKWCVARRYNEFVELRQELIKINELIEDLPFPEKTMFGNMNQDTVSSNPPSMQI